MPTPPYIRKLRERIGSDYLWLSGATAVVYREQDSKVLLVRRSDNGAWTPITGIVDPGESPALTCLREAQEEANVQIEVLELAQVKADPAMQFGNGDRCQFLDHTFLCRWVSGEAKVNDEESSQVRWVDVSDPAERALLSERMLDRIDAALNYGRPLPFLVWSRCRRKSTRPAAGAEEKPPNEARRYRGRGDPPSWRVAPPLIFVTVCYMVLGGSSCFSVGLKS